MGPKGAQALSALPRELGADLLAKAEAYLVDQAGHLGPRDRQPRVDGVFRIAGMRAGFGEIARPHERVREPPFEFGVKPFENSSAHPDPA